VGHELEDRHQVDSPYRVGEIPHGQLFVGNSRHPFPFLRYRVRGHRQNHLQRIAESFCFSVCPRALPLEFHALSIYSSGLFSA
jgi:hypothetical protein